MGDPQGNRAGLGRDWHGRQRDCRTSVVGSRSGLPQYTGEPMSSLGSVRQHLRQPGRRDAVMTSADMTTPGTTPRRATTADWVGLWVLALACLMYVMDLTVLHLAIPQISEQLAPSSAQLLWIIDVYGFLVAGALVTMGTLGDRIGRRKLLLIGAAAFGLTSILAAFATTPEMLIAARALLGLAGATLAPSTLSLIFHMFVDPRQRSVAIGVWIGAFSAGSAVGPVLG